MSVPVKLFENRSIFDEVMTTWWRTASTRDVQCTCTIFATRDQHIISLS